MRKLPLFGAAVGLAVLSAVATPAAAQVSTTPASPAAGWTFSVAPYAWLPSLNADVGLQTPRGGTVGANLSAAPADYLSKLNFITMVGAEARHDRITIMTDLVYTNASLTSGNTRLVSVSPGAGPLGQAEPVLPIPPQLRTSTGNRLAATVWSLAGGYTVLEGDWGNLDAIAGLRMLVLGSTTNFQLSAAIATPDGTLALSRTGSLSLNSTNVDGVAGIKGRINIPGSRLFVPFYADVGGGGVPLTWQVYTGLGWQVADWLDVSAGYRYLAFDKGSNRSIRDLSLSGALVGVNFRF